MPGAELAPGTLGVLHSAARKRMPGTPNGPHGRPSIGDLLLASVALFSPRSVSLLRLGALLSAAGGDFLIFRDESQVLHCGVGLVGVCGSLAFG